MGRVNDPSPDVGTFMGKAHDLTICKKFSRNPSLTPLGVPAETKHIFAVGLLAFLVTTPSIREHRFSK